MIELIRPFYTNSIEELVVYYENEKQSIINQYYKDLQERKYYLETRPEPTRNKSRSASAKTLYENKTFTTARGEDYLVIKYYDRENVLIQFLSTGFVRFVNAGNISKGDVKDPYYPSGKGFGSTGIAYPVKNGNVARIEYTRWMSMLDRAYNHTDGRNPGYEDVEVCDYWKCYENFVPWFKAHFYTIQDYNVELDKDLLVKGNKIYGPDTCCMLPSIINGCIKKRPSAKGKKMHDTPIGVSFNREKQKYEAWINYYGVSAHLGYRNTPEEAFYVYKAAKEAYIKELANKYRYCLEPRVYHALMNYEVDIND